MAKCDSDVRRADEHRRKAKIFKLENNRARSSEQKTIGRLNQVYQKHQSKFEMAFEADYDHRKKIYDARKRIDDDSRLLAEFTSEKKNEKL